MLIDEDNENAPCRINFNYKENKTIEASPAVDDMANMAPFVLSSSEAKGKKLFLLFYCKISKYLLVNFQVFNLTN